MGDRIDRATLLQFISEVLEGNAYCDSNLYEDVLQGAKNLPAADVVERKKGMWLYWWDEPDYDTYECSACGTSFNIPDGNPLEHNYKFCPNCGADMRGVDNE